MVLSEKQMFVTSTPLHREASDSCLDRLFSPISRSQTPQHRSSPRPIRVLPIFRKEAASFLKSLLNNSTKSLHRNSLEVKRIFLEDFPSRLSSRRIPSLESISVKDVYDLLNVCGESFNMQFSLAECFKLYHRVRAVQSLISPYSLHHPKELSVSLESINDGSYSEYPTTPMRKNLLEFRSGSTHSLLHDPSEDSGLGSSFESLASSSSESPSAFYKPFFSPELDILKELGKRGCYSITGLLLSYLSPSDVQAASGVSKTWRGIVLDDRDANKRRCEFLIGKMMRKENKCKIKIKKTSEDRVAFEDLANKHSESSKQPLKKSAHTVFHKFVEAGKNLTKKDILLKCPRCNHPSKRDVQTTNKTTINKYCCTRQLCAYEFCSQCLGPFICDHSCKKTEYRAIPNVVIGSQKSRKSLRRL